MRPACRALQSPAGRFFDGSCREFSMEGGLLSRRLAGVWARERLDLVLIPPVHALPAAHPAASHKRGFWEALGTHNGPAVTWCVWIPCMMNACMVNAASGYLVVRTFGGESA